MTDTIDVTTAPVDRPLRVDLAPRQMLWRRFRRHKAGMVALIVMTVLVLFAVFGPLLWQVDYALTDFNAIGESPSADHPLGTDSLGRDILIRLMIGGRVSLSVALISQILAIAFGTLLGLIAGYTNQHADTWIMRVIDVIMAIPDLLLLILLIPVLSGALESSWTPAWAVTLNDISLGTFGLVVGIFLITWTFVARLVRGQVLTLREMEFVESAVNIGVPRPLIMYRHLLPNLSTILVVAATLGVPRGVLLEAGISFLGLGVSPPLPSWGTMISDGLSVMRSEPHILLAPAIVLSITVLCLNLLGDAIRDAVDPRSST
jgi:ABC-type dipeptide/oligopeptide/nickel transport system permease subunit